MSQEVCIVDSDNRFSKAQKPGSRRFIKKEPHG